MMQTATAVAEVPLVHAAACGSVYKVLYIQDGNLSVDAFVPQGGDNRLEMTHFLRD